MKKQEIERRIENVKSDLEWIGTKKSFLDSLGKVKKDEKEYKEGERWRDVGGHLDATYFYNKKEAGRYFAETKKEWKNELKNLKKLL